jgi:hypothetical protein
MAADLGDFLIPIGSGLVESAPAPGGYLARDRAATLHADLYALADHRARVTRQLRNMCSDYLSVAHDQRKDDRRHARPPRDHGDGRVTHSHK